MLAYFAIIIVIRCIVWLIDIFYRQFYSFPRFGIFYQGKIWQPWLWDRIGGSFDDACLKPFSDPWPETETRAENDTGDPAQDNTAATVARLWQKIFFSSEIEKNEGPEVSFNDTN
jgi:hypothetical protein